MNITTRFSLGDRVRIVRPTKYGENAERLTGCVVTSVEASAVLLHVVGFPREERLKERYTLRCLVPADAMTGAGETSRMLYGLPSACLEREG